MRMRCFSFGFFFLEALSLHVENLKDPEIPAESPLFKTRVWDLPTNPFIRKDSELWPEEVAVPEIRDKKPTAFTCAGGGTKAYTACTGYMRAIHMLIEEEQNIELPKWFVGVSGGSWFSSVYTYADHSVSDLDLLGGPYTPPEELTRQSK